MKIPSMIKIKPIQWFGEHDRLHAGFMDISKISEATQSQTAMYPGQRIMVERESRDDVYCDEWVYSDHIIGAAKKLG
jgi:hypothetical protein